MARIVTVYNTERRAATSPRDMAHIRWIKISEALARLGHQVDMASGEFVFRWPKRPVHVSRNLRRVPLSRVRWEEYDAVKTLFHQGFETLERFGGGDHPFVIAKLGSVVGPDDRPGIYFYGRQRDEMFATQQRIHTRARYVTLLTEPARTLWSETIGHHPGFLLVPGAADREIPPAGPDPYPADRRLRVLFSGNLYDVQPQATRVLSDKLNALGELLRLEARVFVVGPGDTRLLDPRHVTHLGSVPYDASWNHMYHAQVGIVVSAGPFMHNNESTKIYHYLRVGLPVVSEAGFPNDDVVRASGCGVVAPNGDMPGMARHILEVAAAQFDRSAAAQFILSHHTWDHRARVYEEVLRKTGARNEERGTKSEERVTRNAEREEEGRRRD